MEPLLVVERYLFLLVMEMGAQLAEPLQIVKLLTTHLEDPELIQSVEISKDVLEQIIVLADHKELYRELSTFA